MRNSKHERRNPNRYAEQMTSRFPSNPRCDFWGAHAPSRAHFGALAEMPGRNGKQEVRDAEGGIASTRGACAPQTS
jgi:hypothetical protein